MENPVESVNYPRAVCRALYGEFVAIRHGQFVAQAFSSDLTDSCSDNRPRLRLWKTCRRPAQEASRRRAWWPAITHVSVRTVWDDVTAEYEELRRETEVNRADSMALENTRLDQLFSKALSLFANGDVPAGRLAVAVMVRRAKLNGLDAPTKIAPTDPTGEHPADSGAVDVNLLSEDTLRRVLRSSWSRVV